jgi:glycosyltransferase involved in cell wall biosynthesis
MKIALLSDSIYPYNKGGKETRSYELARNLAKRGHEVNFYTMGFWGNKETKKLNKITMHRICKNYSLYSGKGNAIRTAFRKISKDTDYVVMLDGDDTYKSHEIPRMIEPLDSNFADVIIGSRLEGRMNGHALSFSHRLANWFFTFIVRYFYFANVTDTCTGYFAWKRAVIKKLNGYIQSPGFAIEAEMITKMAKLHYKLFSVPITYDPRIGESKLAPVGDGLRITRMLFKNMWWEPKRGK